MEKTGQLIGCTPAVNNNSKQRIAENIKNIIFIIDKEVEMNLNKCVSKFTVIDTLLNLIFRKNKF